MPKQFVRKMIGLLFRMSLTCYIRPGGNFSVIMESEMLYLNAGIVKAGLLLVTFKLKS